MRFPNDCRPFGRFPAQRLSLALLLLVAAWLPARGGSILREVYQGIAGTAISDLTNNPIYPDHPTLTNFVTDLFESPSNFDDNYGQRMHGYITPPVTGNYTFWIATDDNGALFLSTDTEPANVQLIASVPDWAGPREWTKFPEQQSAPIKLIAGQNYYISALEKEGGGGDNLAVRWVRPDGNPVFIKDADGNAVKSRLNEPALKEIAEAGGGFYLPLQGRRTLQTLYERGLAPLPKTEFQAGRTREWIERFQWPLGIAILLLMIEIVLPEQAGSAPRRPASPPAGSLARPGMAAP